VDAARMESTGVRALVWTAKAIEIDFEVAIRTATEIVTGTTTEIVVIRTIAMVVAIRTIAVEAFETTAMLATYIATMEANWTIIEVFTQTKAMVAATNILVLVPLITIVVQAIDTAIMAITLDTDFPIMDYSNDINHLTAVGCEEWDFSTANMTMFRALGLATGEELRIIASG
jgi:hypothetical protein